MRENNARSERRSRRKKATLAPRIKLNRETKNFSRHAHNLRLLKISLYSPVRPMVQKIR